jgi:nucleoid DNA-binding protein
MTYTELIESVEKECLEPLKGKDPKVALGLGMKSERSAFARTILTTFLNQIKATTLTGGEVKIPGFGRFHGKFRPESQRMIAGKMMTIKAKTVIRFKQYY